MVNDVYVEGGRVHMCTVSQCTEVTTIQSQHDLCLQSSSALWHMVALTTEVMFQGYYSCDETSRPKELGRKCLFGLYFHISDHHGKKLGQEIKQGRNLEAGNEAEAMKGAIYCLAFHGWLNLLSYRIQDHQAGMALPTVGWALPHQLQIR